MRTERQVLCPALVAVSLTLAHVAGRQLTQSAGEVCLYDEGQPWRCVPEGECRSRDQLDRCSGSGVVCCPRRMIRPAEPPTPAGTAARKCREYASHVYREAPVFSFGTDRIPECTFRPEPLIFGGQNVEIREFPHMVLLGYEIRGSRNTRTWGCGGSLISERFVLTAAHCVRPKGIPNDVKWVLLGTEKLRGKSSNTRVLRKVVDFYLPRGYNRESMYDDIALLKLETDVPLSPYLRPACLDVDKELPPEAVATGWGRTGTSEIERSSNTLKKVKLPVVSAARCNETYGTSIPGLAKGIDGVHMVCAGAVEGKDTCKGDSGGPLQKKLKEPFCMYSLVGVTSFAMSEACGVAIPGVYTRVSGYLPWITSIVWPSG